MTIAITREQLHKQIDALPDDVVEQIADFTLFLMTRRQIKPAYAEWDKNQWQTFALEHFFRETDDVTYSLDDAQEIYHP
jgi:hypothetical protein